MLECRLIRPDGAVRWMLAKGRLLRDTNALPIRQIGVVLDMTDPPPLSRLLGPNPKVKRPSSWLVVAQA